MQVTYFCTVWVGGRSRSGKTAHLLGWNFKFQNKNVYCKCIRQIEYYVETKEVSKKKNIDNKSSKNLQKIFKKSNLYRASSDSATRPLVVIPAHSIYVSIF